VAHGWPLRAGRQRDAANGTTSAYLLLEVAETELRAMWVLTACNTHDPQGVAGALVDAIAWKLAFAFPESDRHVTE
jgi:hypothetical protein